MRELKVLGDGHLKLDFAELQDFFEQDWAEMARSQLKAIIEQALLAERDRYLELGYYEHAPLSRLDYRNGFYFRVLDFRGTFQLPAVAYLDFCIKHSVHHRGQLSTYLRAMGGKVPAIYGESYDSAEAKKAAAAN